MTKPNLEQTVTLMKAEILRDIAIGRVPKTVSSFSELHDYVDANEYGGFCNGAYSASALQFDTEFCNFVNACQNGIDQWLRSEEFATMLMKLRVSPKEP